MTETVRIGTFNVENLFRRFKFKDKIDVQKAIAEGWTVDKTCFEIHKPTSKRITGKAIRKCKAHVLALQEVENLDTLKCFQTRFLGGRKTYPHMALIDGNDRRRIDVAVISKLPIPHIRTHQHLRTESSKAYIFSRDCLEVDVQLPGGGIVTIFANHFKSMMDKSDPSNGRRNTRARRERQSEEVMKLTTARFGENAGDHDFIVLGDLNDYLKSDSQGDTGIGDLVGWNQVVNVVDRLPKKDRWTHFYKGSKDIDDDDGYHQLDYVLLSKSLADKNPQEPVIERRGQPKRVKRFTGKRFKEVGLNRPKASDHCPVMMDIKV